MDPVNGFFDPIKLLLSSSLTNQGREEKQKWWNWAKEEVKRTQGCSDLPHFTWASQYAYVFITKWPFGMKKGINRIYMQNGKQAPIFLWYWIIGNCDIFLQFTSCNADFLSQNCRYKLGIASYKVRIATLTQNSEK